ncbi:MAG TPA: lysophospholipid acyltransferase family protein [Alphaproteobacteria bacterium]
MTGSPARALARILTYLAITLPLMPVQAIALAVGSRIATTLPRRYHNLCCRMIGIRVDVRGKISTARPTLFVANHVSYMDIPVLGSVLEVSFIAKREVRGWPLFGWLARLQQTVFVDRRAAGVRSERDEVARRLACGDNLVLFAEGTSGDGNRIKPFKSSLFSVAEHDVGGQPVVVQPVTIAYTRLDEMPLGRSWRPYVAWYGDMDLAPHAWQLLGLGRLTVTLHFHEPVSFAQFGSRKSLAEHCGREIARGLALANAGRDASCAVAAASAALASP